MDGPANDCDGNNELPFGAHVDKAATSSEASFSIDADEDADMPSNEGEPQQSPSPPASDSESTPPETPHLHTYPQHADFIQSLSAFNENLS